MQTIVYQCDTAMPAQKLPNCCYLNMVKNNSKTTSHYHAGARQNAICIVPVIRKTYTAPILKPKIK